MKLYSYYRSSCSWRVRIALNLTNCKYEYIPVNLLKSEQSNEEYLEKNPSGLVPLLALDDGTLLAQSIAIIEYLNDTCAANLLLPSDPILRAIARQAVNIIAADTQPLQNLRVVKALQEKGPAWAQDIIGKGLHSFLKIVQKYGGQFSVGDQVTMADIVLVPQLYNARRFSVDLSEFGTLLEIEKRLLLIDAFKMASPDVQPDSPATNEQA